jgi:hypothetical protein
VINISENCHAGLRIVKNFILMRATLPACEARINKHLQAGFT